MSSSQKTLGSRLFKAYKIFSIGYTTFSIITCGTLAIALAIGGYNLHRRQEDQPNNTTKYDTYSDFDTCY